MAFTDLTIQTFTIALSGTVSNAIDLQGYDTFTLDVPTLDSTTLVVSGSIDGAVFRPIKDQSLNQVLSLAANTGNFILDATDAIRAVGCKSIMIVLGSPQNTGARSIRLKLKAPFRSDHN